MNSFHVEGPVISFLRTDQKLTKFSFKNPIVKQKKQRVAIKILRTKERFIYLGIESENQRKDKKVAAAQGKEMISYRANGGKQLHVLNRDKEKVPPVNEGETLTMEVNYPERSITWIVGK